MRETWRKISNWLEPNQITSERDILENPRIPEENILRKGSETQKKVYWSAILCGKEQACITDPTSEEYNNQITLPYRSVNLDYTEEALDQLEEDHKEITVWSGKDSSSSFTKDYSVKYIIEILNDFDRDEINAWSRVSGCHYEKEEFIVSEAGDPPTLVFGYQLNQNREGLYSGI